MKRSNLIDWRKIVVRTKSGRVLVAATMDLVEYELGHFMWLERTGSEAAMSVETTIDWKAFTDKHGADVRGNDGSLDAKLVIKVAREELTAWIDAENAREAEEKKFNDEIVGAIHAFFIEVAKWNKNPVQRQYIIPTIVSKLGYSYEADVDKYEKMTEKVENYIKSDGETFAMTRSGPVVYVYRLKDHNGKSTGVELEGVLLKPYIATSTNGAADIVGDNDEGTTRPRFGKDIAAIFGDSDAGKSLYKRWHASLAPGEPTSGPKAKEAMQAWKNKHR